MKSVLDIHSLIGRSSVRVGRILVPPGAVEGTLYRYAKALVYLNTSEEFPYSIRGTMSGLRLGTRYFSIFCKHQIAEADPGKVGLFPRAAGGKFYICGGTFRDILLDGSNLDEEFIDVCGIEYVPDRFQIPNLSSEFFDVIPDDCWPSNSLGHLIAFGLPSNLQKFELDPSEGETRLSHIKFSTVVVGGK